MKIQCSNDLSAGRQCSEQASYPALMNIIFIACCLCKVCRMIAKFLFAALLLFHGLIHSLGFIKAYRIAAVSQLSRHIGKTAGSLWLLTALLFLMAFGLFVGGRQWWWPGAVALLLSQGLILSAWVDARWGTLANVIILAAVVIAWATHNYKQSTPVKDYKEINGYRIAGFAEAIYHYPAGDFCYGTFKVKELRYSVSGGR